MTSAKASSGQSLDGNVLETYQKDFSGKVEGLQMTASKKLTDGFK